MHGEWLQYCQAQTQRVPGTELALKKYLLKGRTMGQQLLDHIKC